MEAALELIARERQLLKSSRKSSHKENVDPEKKMKTKTVERENRELKRRVRDLDALTKDLRSQLSHEIKMSSTIASSQKESDIRNDEKDMKIETLEGSLRRTEKMLSEKSEKLEKLREEMSDAEEKMNQNKDHNKKRLDEAREMLRLEKQRNEELERLLSTCLNDQSNKSRSQAERVERELRGKMREQAKRFQNHLRDANEIMKETLAKQKHDFQREIEVLKEALDASRSVNEEYSERLEKMNVKITDEEKLRAAIKKCHERNEEMKRENERLKIESTSSVEEMRRTIEELNSKQREGEMISSDMLRMLRSAQQEARSRQEELCRLREVLEKERTEREQRKIAENSSVSSSSHQDFVDDAILRARTLTKRAKNVACQALTEQIQELTSETCELRDKVTELERSLELESTSSQKIRLELETANEMNRDLISTRENLRVANDVIARTQHRVETLEVFETRCKTQENTIREQSGKLTASKCALEASRARIQKLEESETKLTEELDIVTSQLETLARRFTQCEQNKELLQEEHDELTLSLKRTQEDLDRERSTVNTMSATMKQNEMIVAELRQRVEKNNEMLEISRKENNEAQEKEMERLRSREKISRESLESREEKIRELETEMVTKTEYVKQLEVAVKTATETLKSLMKRRESEKLSLNGAESNGSNSSSSSSSSTATEEWRQRHQILNRYRSTPITTTPRLTSSGRHLFGGVGLSSTRGSSAYSTSTTRKSSSAVSKLGRSSLGIKY